MVGTISSRSLKIDPKCINKAKLALTRNRFPSQVALATELGFARSTVNNFFNSRPVERLNFVEICEKLALDWQEIALLEDYQPEDTAANQLVNLTINQESRLPDLVGTTIGGRYKIIELLGKEKNGETYVAVHEHLPNNPQRVIKRLKSESSETARHLFREAQVLSQLGDHPHIPTLFDSFDEDGYFYLVQQFIDGYNLSQELIEGQPWSEPQVIALMRDILEILKFVHRCKLIHRNINPHNLIRCHTDNKLVLINFGSVKQISTGQERSYAGSPAYTPPEQAMGRPKLCSDIYAVGILGIQALSGLHPKKLEGEGIDIIWRNKAQVSPELANLLDKMVCSDDHQRYQSAEEALQAFQGLETFGQA
jgi:serine/threonine protein kinase